METFIVIAALLLAALVLAFRFGKPKPALTAAASYSAQLPEWTGQRGLFDDPAKVEDLAQLETARLAEEARAALLVRAEAGDRDVLVEALASKGLVFYREALDVLTMRARNDDEGLQALLRHVAQNGHWRANVMLAEAALARWQKAPERYALGELLHVAALSDDAAVYQKVVEATMRMWRAGRLAWVSPRNLRALIESEYWILAPEARQAGAGFVLKRMLVAVRRELAAATQQASLT
jgi:hypothetical protein